MSVKKRKHTVIRGLFIIITILTLSLSLASCDVINSLLGKQQCTEHKDADGDNICDVCREEIEPAPLPPCEHSDTDGDGVCDECNSLMPTPPCTEHKDDDCNGLCDGCGESVGVSHSDTDGDGKCNKCNACISHRDADASGECDNCSACLTHVDGNCDGKCDRCNAEVEINHENANGDRKCDKCNACLVHVDGNCDGKCDDCDAAAQITHRDANDDGKCDGCSACLSHRDGDCNDKCDNCAEAVKLGHSDKNADGVCDKCGKCISHVDALCDGVCDRAGCGSTVEIIHKDEDGNNVCDKCGATVLPISYTAKKTASVPRGAMLYPASYIEWSGTVRRGSLITYTITVTNTGENVATLVITDAVPSGTTYVSGCDAVTDNIMTWTLSVPVGEEASVSYTVYVNGKENAVGTYISGGSATVGDKKAECYDLYIGKPLNEVDEKYIERAIKILSGSTYEALEFAKHAYTVAFTNPKAITELLTGSPAEVLALAINGTNQKLAQATVYKYGDAELPTVSHLVSGDLVFISANGTVRLYMICGDEAYDITKRATRLDVGAVLEKISTADGYAVVRPSVTMTAFTPSDPDEKPEAMTKYQEAIVKTAEAYLMRGESLQYEDVNFGLTSKTGEYRWACGQKAPEEYTLDEWGYVNCAVFTYDVYLQALGYALPNKMYTTANLSSYSDSNGMRVFRFENTTPGEYTEEFMLEIEREVMQTIQVGEIINVRRKTASGTSGHAMLYVGNGRFIHSGGSSYTSVNGVGYEIYEPTIRCHKVADYIFNPTSVGGYPFRGADDLGSTYVTELILVRPLNKFSGTIPENTVSRVENMDGIKAEKLSSHPSSVTVNAGEIITFTFSLYNLGDVARTVEIFDKIPEGTTYVSGGDRVVGDELYWTVVIPAGERVTVSYSVRVKGDLADGTVIGSRDATVGGVMHRCADVRVKKTLTEAEQNAIIAAIEAIKSEGTSLTKLELVNEIYRRALGVAPFTSTNANEVIRDGEDSVFAKSSVTHNGKNLSTLRTDETYYSRMLVDHLYGGMRFYSANKLYDRTRLLKAHNLIVGDVLIARSSSAENVYIYAGDGNLILLNSGVGAAADFTSLAERILYYGRDFAVLRPSQVME